MPHTLSIFRFQFSPPSERHYNSALSIWLSVDPMSDKYPSTSPYAYCANNPVRLVDPNGEEIEITLSKFSSKNQISLYESGGPDDPPKKTQHNNGFWGMMHKLDLAVQGHSDNTTCDGGSAVEPYVESAVLFFPPVSFINNSKTILTGSDLYENKADALDYVLSIGGLASLPTRTIKNSIGVAAKWTDKATTAFTSMRTFIRNYSNLHSNEKKEDKK